MATITVKDVKKAKSGEKNGKKWTLYKVTDAQGVVYSTFDAEWLKHVGETVEADVTEDERGDRLGACPKSQAQTNGATSADLTAILMAGVGELQRLNNLLEKILKGRDPDVASEQAPPPPAPGPAPSKSEAPAPAQAKPNGDSGAASAAKDGTAIGLAERRRLFDLGHEAGLGDEGIRILVTGRTGAPDTSKLTRGQYDGLIAELEGRIKAHKAAEAKANELDPPF